MGRVLTEKLRFKLDNKYSNNQAEQLAIVKALEVIQTQQVNHNEHRTAVIYTDSKITLDSVRSAINHIHLVEEIRKRAVALKKNNGQIEFKWIKESRRNFWKRNRGSNCEGGISKLPRHIK